MLTLLLAALLGGGPISHVYSTETLYPGSEAEPVEVVFEVPQYDGEVAAVEVCFTPVLQLQHFAEHTGNAIFRKSIQMEGRIRAELHGLPGHPEPLILTLDEDQNFVFGDYDGTTDFAGSSGDTSKLHELMDPIDVLSNPDAWEGTGTVTLTFKLWARHFHSGPANMTSITQSTGTLRALSIHISPKRGAE